MRAVVHQVADGTYLVHGSNTNWIILTDGGDATLIDTGYPGDRASLLESLTKVGIAPERVAAVLLTHAHNDHLGSAEYLRTAHGTPVLMHEAEVPHARRDFLHQVSVGTVLRNGWRPGVLPWALHTLRAGGTAQHPVAEPRPFPVGGALDLPGRPVPVPTPGHTEGHCAYHLPDVGVVVPGDALVTDHPTSRATGPQLLPGMFHHERARAVASLSFLTSLDADLLLPGHGPAHRGPTGAGAGSGLKRVSRMLSGRRVVMDTRAVFPVSVIRCARTAAPCRSCRSASRGAAPRASASTGATTAAAPSTEANRRRAGVGSAGTAGVGSGCPARSRPDSPPISDINMTADSSHEYADPPPAEA